MNTICNMPEGQKHDISNMMKLMLAGTGAPGPGTSTLVDALMDRHGQEPVLALYDLTSVRVIFQVVSRPANRVKVYVALAIEVPEKDIKQSFVGTSEMSGDNLDDEMLELLRHNPIIEYEAHNEVVSDEGTNEEN